MGIERVTREEYVAAREALVALASERDEVQRGGLDALRAWSPPGPLSGGSPGSAWCIGRARMTWPWPCGGKGHGGGPTGSAAIRSAAPHGAEPAHRRP